MIFSKNGNVLPVLVILSLAATACVDDDEPDISGDAGSDASTDTDTDADTDCDTSGFHSEFENLGGSDPAHHDVLFACPTSISIPVDAAPYKDPQFILDFNGYLRGLAAPWIDESCFSCCDLDTDQILCIEADCVTGSGATLYYRYEESFKPADDMYSPDRSSWSETIEITPPSGAETWEKLEIELQRTTDSGGADCGWGTSHTFNVEWTGSILSDWPVDFAVSSFHRDLGADIYEWIDAAWNHSQCGVEMRISDEESIDFGGTHLVEIGPDELEVMKPSSESNFQGWINDVCVGEVDEDTWEITGPC